MVAGRGLVQADGGPVRVMRAGDTVWARPASATGTGRPRTSFVAHIAISLGATSWAEPVGADQYSAVPIIGEP